MCCRCHRLCTQSCSHMRLLAACGSRLLLTKVCVCHCRHVAVSASSTPVPLLVLDVLALVCAPVLCACLVVEVGVLGQRFQPGAALRLRSAGWLSAFTIALAFLFRVVLPDYSHAFTLPRPFSDVVMVLAVLGIVVMAVPRRVALFSPLALRVILSFALTGLLALVGVPMFMWPAGIIAAVAIVSFRYHRKPQVCVRARVPLLLGCDAAALIMWSQFGGMCCGRTMRSLPLLRLEQWCGLAIGHMAFSGTPARGDECFVADRCFLSHATPMPASNSPVTMLPLALSRSPTHHC